MTMVTQTAKTLDEGIASTIAWYKEANEREEVRK